MVTNTTSRTFQPASPVTGRHKLLVPLAVLLSNHCCLNLSSNCHAPAPSNCRQLKWSPTGKGIIAFVEFEDVNTAAYVHQAMQVRGSKHLLLQPTV